MFIDVQSTLLYYLVAAWTDDFSGFVIDYGTYPDQQRPYFVLRAARPTLAQATGMTSPEATIYAGLERLGALVLTHEWRREDGANLRIERCLVDAGYMSDTVYQFARQSAFASLLIPSHGRFVGASSAPFDEYRRKAGDRLGQHWRMPNVQGRRSVRYVLFDTNFWKSFVHARLSVPMGERGCLSLYGEKPERHRLIAEHWTSEYPVKTEAKMRPGRVVDEWKLKPERPDNHWFDCLVGAAVAASMGGSALRPAPVVTAHKPRPFVGTRVNLRRPDGRPFFITQRRS